MSSFAKAGQLLELGLMVSARRVGITLNEVEARFGVSHRTAQRMLRELEAHFPDVESHLDDEGRKRWRIDPAQLRQLMSVSADELAALDLGIAHLERANLAIEAKTLTALKDKVMSLIPRPKVTRLETDHDALLEAQGFVARPGPRPRIDQECAANIAEAIKACRCVELSYRSHRDGEPKIRRVAPYGLLSGLRRYLVAVPSGDTSGAIRTYRMDAIYGVQLTSETFVRPESFDLQTFANRSFGVFQDDHEYGEVVWRFKPEAAEHARGFVFHPDQTTELADDGSLIVRFQAAGHLEMCWHLYAWGDKVEVVCPPRLREMVNRHQRNDFSAMP